jgi:hypothetical protein
MNVSHILSKTSPQQDLIMGHLATLEAFKNKVRNAGQSGVVNLSCQMRLEGLGVVNHDDGVATSFLQADSLPEGFDIGVGGRVNNNLSNITSQTKYSVASPVGGWDVQSCIQVLYATNRRVVPKIVLKDDSKSFLILYVGVGNVAQIDTRLAAADADGDFQASRFLKASPGYSHNTGGKHAWLDSAVNNVMNGIKYSATSLRSIAINTEYSVSTISVPSIIKGKLGGKAIVLQSNRSDGLRDISPIILMSWLNLDVKDLVDFCKLGMYDEYQATQI